MHAYPLLHPLLTILYFSLVKYFFNISFPPSPPPLPMSPSSRCNIRWPPYLFFFHVLSCLYLSHLLFLIYIFLFSPFAFN
ncbi:hypothetical protein BO71DRAFT_6773 [Aspergillus ellipticus CBS 707.79]|uniref:Uncharacterized protein n=1 Tax=Aspergillus ellipticus CBS 707.79 TaxID=1448320 RepID=A0A319D7J8_9EURO|nr:hypothetical protein BO71DRAFT_6773 [Aspergillus ellipticus CBS 707.79]